MIFQVQVNPNSAEATIVALDDANGAGFRRLAQLTEELVGPIETKIGAYHAPGMPYLTIVGRGYTAVVVSQTAAEKLAEALRKEGRDVRVDTLPLRKSIDLFIGPLRRVLMKKGDPQWDVTIGEASDRFRTAKDVRDIGTFAAESMVQGYQDDTLITWIP